MQEAPLPQYELVGRGVEQMVVPAGHDIYN